MTPNDTPTEWFCVGFDGNIHSLGQHEDFDGASDAADDMGGSPWIFDSETARDWRDALNAFLITA